jgi:hypothetical protein
MSASSDELIVSLAVVLACFGLTAYILRGTPAHPARTITALTSLVGALATLLYAVRG